jgi:hypothetical protein
MQLRLRMCKNAAFTRYALPDSEGLRRLTSSLLGMTLKQVSWRLAPPTAACSRR